MDKRGKEGERKNKVPGERELYGEETFAPCVCSSMCSQATPTVGLDELIL